MNAAASKAKYQYFFSSLSNTFNKKPFPPIQRFNYWGTLPIAQKSKNIKVPNKYSGRQIRLSAFQSVCYNKRKDAY